MTTEDAIRQAKTRWARRRRRLIGYGQWQPFTDAEPVRQHVLAIRAAGMSIKTLSQQTNVGVATIDHLLYGNTPYPPAAKIRVESAHALLAYWPRLDDYHDGSVIDATGTRRRLRALAAIGWPAVAIHRHIGFGNVKTIEHGHYNEQVTARFARAIRDLYAWGSTGQAEDHGVTPWIANRCRNRAAKLTWEPPTVWDDDLIDDPNAAPDWTGHCGTDRGWWIHRLQRIPMCQRCQAAHAEWKQQHQHLDRNALMSELGKARAAAATREADLAADARELIRLGASYEQAADRLGVSRPHLHQALTRHPETEGAAA